MIFESANKLQIIKNYTCLYLLNNLCLALHLALFIDLLNHPTVI